MTAHASVGHTPRRLPRATFQADHASPMPEQSAAVSEHDFGRIAVTSPTSLASYREERQTLRETFSATIQRDNPKGSPLPGEVDTSTPAPAEEGEASPQPMRGWRCRRARAEQVRVYLRPDR